MPKVQEVKGSQDGTYDGGLTNISHDSLSTLFHTHWCRPFWPFERKERKSGHQEMGRLVHLSKLLGHTPRIGLVLGNRLFH